MTIVPAFKGYSTTTTTTVSVKIEKVRCFFVIQHNDIDHIVFKICTSMQTQIMKCGLFVLGMSLRSTTHCFSSHVVVFHSGEGCFRIQLVIYKTW